MSNSKLDHQPYRDAITPVIVPALLEYAAAALDAFERELAEKDPALLAELRRPRSSAR